MLDFKKQQEVEREYFSKNTKRKKMYKIFLDYLWLLSGFTNPVTDFNHSGVTEEDKKQIFKDYAAVQSDESFNNEEFCKDMLESKVAYDWRQGDTGKELVDKSPNYLYKYIMIFGKEKVAAWAQELIDRVDHVDRNTYTDCEGCSYNSIIYKE